MGYIVALTNGSPLQVVLVNPDNMQVGIICGRTEAGWQPLYGVRPDQRFELPSCFSLNDDAIEALDSFLQIQGI
jgi:hypothetical protein